MIRLNTSDIKRFAPELEPGVQVLLTGIVYTARDAAHKRIIAALRQGAPLPFPLEGAVIYYAGPTPSRPGTVIGSCGPTTSSRMDFCAAELYDAGVYATIGKGERSDSVNESIIRNGAVYFAAVGGAGALYSKCVESLRVIAYDDLGCESVKELYVRDFPVYTRISPYKQRNQI